MDIVCIRNLLFIVLWVNFLNLEIWNKLQEYLLQMVSKNVQY